MSTSTRGPLVRGADYRRDVSSATPSLAGPAPATGVPRRPRAERWALPVLRANLVAQILIVVTGGAVRLTKSGLGCSTWPQCEPGQFTPVWHEAVSWHPYIEFGNRTLTGVLGILALATAWVVWRRTDRALGLRVLGLVPLVLTAVQAVVGGTVVLAELNPLLVGGHFLLSMLLIAASTALLLRFREGDGPPQPLVGPAVRSVGRALVPLVAVVLVLGVLVTGAGPHSGDADVAARLPFVHETISRLHSGSVLVYVAVLLTLLVLVLRRPHAAVVRRGAWVLLGGTLLQALIGYSMYFTALPTLLVGLHMLGASVLVVAQTYQWFSMRERPVVPERPGGLAST